MLYIACKFAVVITSNSDKPTKWLHSSIDNCAYNIIFDYISQNSNKILVIRLKCLIHSFPKLGRCPPFECFIVRSII